MKLKWPIWCDFQWEMAFLSLALMPWPFECEEFSYPQNMVNGMNHGKFTYLTSSLFYERYIEDKQQKEGGSEKPNI